MSRRIGTAAVPVEPEHPCIDSAWMAYIVATGMSDGWLGWPRRFRLWWRR